MQTRFNILNASKKKKQIARSAQAPLLCIIITSRIVNRRFDQDLSMEYEILVLSIVSKTTCMFVNKSKKGQSKSSICSVNIDTLLTTNTS